MIGTVVIAYANKYTKPPAFILTTKNAALQERERHLMSYLMKKGGCWADVPVVYLAQDLKTISECHTAAGQAIDIDCRSLFSQVQQVAGIPPCGPLSMLAQGNSKARVEKNEKLANRLMYKMVRFVLKEIAPNVLLLENAPALATDMGFSVRRQLARIAWQQGYLGLNICHMSALHAGMAQSRLRTFVTIWRQSAAPTLQLKMTDCPTPSRVLDQVGDPGRVLGCDLMQSPLFHWLLHYLGKKPEGENIAVAEHVLAGKPQESLLRYIFTSPERVASAEEWLEDGRWLSLARFRKEYNVFKQCKQKGCAYDEDTPVFIGAWTPTITKKNVRLLVHPCFDERPQYRRFLRENEVKMLAMGLPSEFDLLVIQPNLSYMLLKALLSQCFLP